VGLAVRTGWALLRSLGFLVLIGHVRRGRTVARPFGLILAVTTVFAVGRLIVPRQGVPPLPGLLGFGLLTALCVVVVWLLYRSPTLDAHLVRHRKQLVVDRQGVSWKEVAPRRPPVAGWLLTTRVAAFTYSPLMLVPCLVAAGGILDGRLIAVPAVLFWFGAGIAASYAVLFCTFFLLRGRRWARGLLVGVTLVVLAVDLPLCWFPARPGRAGPRRRAAGGRRRPGPLRLVAADRGRIRCRRGRTGSRAGLTRRWLTWSSTSQWWEPAGQPLPHWPPAGPAPGCCCRIPTSRDKACGTDRRARARRAHRTGGADAVAGHAR
jgi:hypothetical protein